MGRVDMSEMLIHYTAHQSKQKDGFYSICTVKISIIQKSLVRLVDLLKRKSNVEFPIEQRKCPTHLPADDAWFESTSHWPEFRSQKNKYCLFPVFKQYQKLFL